LANPSVSFQETEVFIGALVTTLNVLRRLAPTAWRQAGSL